MNQLLKGVKYFGYHDVSDCPSIMSIVPYVTMLFLCCAKHMTIKLMLIDSLVMIMHMYNMMINTCIPLMVLIMVSMMMSCMNVCIWWAICSCIHKFWWLGYFNIQVEIGSLGDIISDIQVEIGYLYPSGDRLIGKMTPTSKRSVPHACRSVWWCDVVYYIDYAVSRIMQTYVKLCTWSIIDWCCLLQTLANGQTCLLWF